MENEKQIVIHVGLPKTGTTFLQKYVFPKIKDINFISDYNTGGEGLLLLDKLYEDKINFISYEGFSHGLGKRYMRGKYASRCEIAHRLKRLFPKAKIIVTFRNKEDWVRSFYNTYLGKPDRENGGLKYDDFRTKILYDDDLDFEEYEKCLKSLFNEVLVLQFEELKNDPDNFIKKICDFMNVDFPDYDNVNPNPKMNKKQLERWRKTNKTLKKLGLPYGYRKYIRSLIKRIN